MENRCVFIVTFVPLHPSNITSMPTETESCFSDDHFQCEKSDQGWKIKSRPTDVIYFVDYLLPRSYAGFILTMTSL